MGFTVKGGVGQLGFRVRVFRACGLRLEVSSFQRSVPRLTGWRFRG